MADDDYETREMEHTPGRRQLTITRYRMVEAAAYTTSIVAIDPGVTTGIATFHHRNDKNDGTSVTRLTIGQVGQDEISRLVNMITSIVSYRFGTTIVYEKYVVRPSRHGLVGAQANRELSPVEVMGQIRGHFDAIFAIKQEKTHKTLQKPEFVPQQASEMASFPDKRVKSMFSDTWKLTCGPVMPHGRDALRHLLVYLKRHHFALYQALKP